MIVMSTAADDGPLPEDLLYIRRDVDLLRLIALLDAAGFDLLMRADRHLVLVPSVAEQH